MAENAVRWAPLAEEYYRVFKALVPFRDRILQIANQMLELEGGAHFDDVWVEEGKSYIGRYLGTTILTKDGLVVLRVAIGRSADAVADTIIHEVAHRLLGVQHIRKGSHGEDFSQVYDSLKKKYQGYTVEALEAP